MTESDAHHVPFPDAFTWGVATSAFQIEGSPHADGRSPSIWDSYVHTPGRTRDGSNADVSCDSYRHPERDVQCLKELGVSAYRLSIAWPRILPQGRGTVNAPGVDYYSRLVDMLLEAGITPYVTLYHWDLPQMLEDEGGWTSRAMADIFADYAGVVVNALGDRVKHWLTFNEIHAFVDQGYGGESKAPARELPSQEVCQVYHHVLLAHGRAVRRMRAERNDLIIGTAENPRTAVPVIATEANIAAARLAWDRRVGFLFEPMHHGRYPEGLERYPDIQDGDMEEIAAPLDLVGLNIYSGALVEASDEAPGFRILPFPAEHPRSPTESWIQHLPDAAYWAVRFATEKCDADNVYVFESGYPIPTADDPDDDVTRITVVRSYMQQLQRAAAEGYPLRGYFYWSLTDSYEWRSGRSSRFGLYRTNYETQERTPRLSARWYAEVVRRNGIV